MHLPTPQANLISLLVLAIPTPFSLARISCSIDLAPESVPSAADCHQIIARLPAFPGPKFSFAPGGRSLSDSSPFLPGGVFIHGNCMAVIDLIAEAGSTFPARTLGAYMNMLRHLPAGRMGPEKMSFVIWTSIRLLAHRVVEECVTQQQNRGFGDGLYSVPGVEGGLRLVVIVMGTKGQEGMGGVFGDILGDLRGALEWGQRPGWNGSRGGERWVTGLFDV